MAVNVGMLIELIGNDYKAGELLPTIRVLANRFGCSVTTVCSALRLLREAGAVTREGRRLRFLNAANTKELLGKPQRKFLAARMVEELSLELLSKTIEHIPSQKEISERYGCSRKTITRVLNSLEKSGMIKRQRGGYVIEHTTTQSSASVFLAGDAPFFENIAGSFRFSIIVALERELARLGWNPLHFFLGGFPQKSADALGSVAGFVHFFARNSYWQDFLKSYRQPLVLMDVADAWESSPVDREQLGRNPLDTLVLSLDNVQAGRDVARHVLLDGHREIACIMSPNQFVKPEDWELNRLRGMQEVFDSVHIELLRFVPPKTMSPAGLPSDQTGNEMSDELVKTGFLADDEIALGLISVLRCEAARLNELMLTCRCLHSLFEEALQSRATVWICTTDMVAAAAKAFLLSRRNDAVLIVGFDNSEIAYRLGISSYDFLLERLGHLAIQFIYRPASVYRKKNEMRIKLSGTLIARRKGPLLT